MATVLITGCSRGIGLALAREYRGRGDRVIATCRDPGQELAGLDVRVIDGIDVADPRGVDKLRAAIGDEAIDILINNAGVLQRDEFGRIDYEVMLDHFEVNTLGPLRVTEALAGNLRKGSKIAIITSRVGSIADNSSGGYWGYRVSKTAVNMVGTNLMHEFRPRGVAVALLHPGLVATDMSSRNGVAPRESAAGLAARIDELNMDNTGSFWHAEGYELPW